MKKQILIALFLPFIASAAWAQNNTVPVVTDGFNAMMQHAKQFNPSFDLDVRNLNLDIQQKSALYTQPAGTANKTTAYGTIPVVFHFVLTAAQQQQMGGLAGIQDRVQTQLDALNADYNAANPDTATIPAPFKPLKGNLGVHFGLAHTDPQGHYTPGYEIITTTQAGFSVDSGTTGSHYACSDAKFASSGGADGWDPTKYMNVWIANITPLGVGGVGTPPPYAAYGGTAAFPWNEQGIVITYWAFGKKTNISTYFLSPAAKVGRTLVHETGHFLNLFHPFGMSTFNNSNCQDDDGVTDTPPQSAPTQSTCPVFPVLDACSPAAPGIMFMNHMDYSADTCRTMFSLGQVTRMKVELDTNGNRHSLLLHPGLLNNGTTGVANINVPVSFNLYPNPARNNCTVSFNNDASHPQSVALLNSIGQQLCKVIPGAGSKTAVLDISGYPGGIYMVQVKYAEGIKTEKLIISK